MIPTLLSHRRRTLQVAVVGLLIFFSPPKASATGLYEDPLRLSSFLRAPPLGAVESEVVRTNAPAHDASVYFLRALLPLKPRLLVRAELSYVSLTRAGDIDNGFGDFRVRARIVLWSDAGRAVDLAGSFRAGSGTSVLFPYSTASVDFEAGLAVVDTLPRFTGWVSATGTYPTRVSDHLKSTKLYPSFATFAGGIVVPVAASLDVEGGALAYLLRSQGNRQMYFVGLDFRYTKATAFFASFQAEGGDGRERAVDFAVGIGLRVTY